VNAVIQKNLGEHVQLSRGIEFRAINENGDPCIRSIDFEAKIQKATRNIPHNDWRRGATECAEITLVVDSKFSTDEHYLFEPSNRPKNHSWPYLIPALTDDGWGRNDLKIHRKDLVSFGGISDIPLASSGKRVKEQSRERDSVASATLQVVQGLTHFFGDRALSLGDPTGPDSSYLRNAYYFIPIVVTNSPLLMLKKDVTVGAVDSSKDEREIIDELDLVCLELPNLFDLKESWNRARKALGQTQHKKLVWLDSGIEDGVILFATVDGLERYLGELRKKFDAISAEPQR
jgi:hypothetical protein